MNPTNIFYRIHKTTEYKKECKLYSVDYIAN